MTLTKSIEAARDGLQLAKDIFDKYHDNHMAKTPPDVNKALSNSEAALDMHDALAALPDKAKTEAELFDIIHTYFRQQNSVLSFHKAQTDMIIKALKAANVLYVSEEK